VIAVISCSEIAYQNPPAFDDIPVIASGNRELLGLEGWDFDPVYGTNLAHALQLARPSCRSANISRIVIVAYNKPSAHIQPDGSAFFCYPPVRETIEATNAEGVRCREAGLRMDTVALGGYTDNHPTRLDDLVEGLAEVMGGVVVAVSSDEPVETAVERILATFEL
jgi:uncharacterized protein with von Willebrand factor type A (vWA) domain